MAVVLTGRDGQPLPYNPDHRRIFRADMESAATTSMYLVCRTFGCRGCIVCIPHNGKSCIPVTKRHAYNARPTTSPRCRCNRRGDLRSSEAFIKHRGRVVGDGVHDVPSSRLPEYTVVVNMRTTEGRPYTITQRNYQKIHLGGFPCPPDMVVVLTGRDGQPVPYNPDHRRIFRADMEFAPTVSVYVQDVRLKIMYNNYTRNQNK